MCSSRCVDVSMDQRERRDVASLQNGLVVVPTVLLPVGDVDRHNRSGSRSTIPKTSTIAQTRWIRMCLVNHHVEWHHCRPTIVIGDWSTLLVPLLPWLLFLVSVWIFCLCTCHRGVVIQSELIFFESGILAFLSTKSDLLRTVRIRRFDYEQLLGKGQSYSVLTAHLA